MRTISKKIIPLILIASFVVPSLIFPAPQKAHAALPTFDGANVVQSTISAIADVGSQISTYTLQYKETVLDGIAYYIAKAIIRQLTTDIVDWINNGFEGNPAFISDPAGFFLNVADSEISKFIEGVPGLESPLAFLCDPFSIDIRIALALRYSPFKRRITCSVKEVFQNTKNAVDGFTSGNFYDGGWRGWVTITEEPQNNRFGAYLESQNELEIRVANALDIKNKESTWGSGFLSWKKCTPTGRENTAERADQGTGEGDYTGPERSFEGSGEGYVPEVHCETQTPGKVISDGLANTLGSPIRQLELADEFNEIINALLVQMVKQVLGPGDGLRGVSGKGRADTTSLLYRLETEQSAAEVEALANIKSKSLEGVNKSIEDENAYRKSKDDSLSAVIAARNMLTDVQTCYQNKINNSAVPLTANQANIARERIADAERVIDQNITPVATPLLREVDLTNTILLALNKIADTIQNAKTINDTSSAAREYERLIVDKKLHTAIDIVNAGQEKETVVNNMNNLNSQTSVKLQECSIFPINTF